MSEPKLIKTWDELRECTSETHVLHINKDGHSGWIKAKEGHGFHYLSTHTFYGKTHEDSTDILQKCGFNVVLANWDE